MKTIVYAKDELVENDCGLDTGGGHKRELVRLRDHYPKPNR